jgi:predicted nucleic acid-binding protein
VIFVDSNVLIDVVEFDPIWEQWSSVSLEQAGKNNPLVINEIVVAETAPRTASLEVFRTSLHVMGIVVESLCVEAAYLAGVTFQDYRKRRSDVATKSLLADFLIGGHAQTLGATILTRDPRFYRTYFPTVPLITPDKAES